jgi:hypothetical protein
LLWLRLALAYENEEADRSRSTAGIKNPRACAAASLSRRCLAASIAHYACFTARTESSSSSSSSITPLGGCLPSALALARSIFERNLPEGYSGDTYALPMGTDASVFEQQWLRGGAAAEEALMKVTRLRCPAFCQCALADLSSQEDDFIDARNA